MVSTPPPRPDMPRALKVVLVFLTVLTLAVIGFSYLGQPLGSSVTPAMAVVFQSHWIGISVHIIASAVALAVAPLQLSNRVRRRAPQVHRWSGRAYLLLGVVPGGVAGFYMGMLSANGWVARSGFVALATLWLTSGWVAYRAIRRRDVPAHRRWMLRNVSLTCAAITLRIYMPLSGVAGLPFEAAYPVVAWLSWVPNLLAAEWWIRRSRGPTLRDRPGLAAA